MKHIGVCRIWSVLAELATERKNSSRASWIWKSVKLHLQSPQTAFMSSCVCPGRASICHQKDAPAPVIRDLALHPDNTPQTVPQSPENHFQGPSSCIVPTNTTSHPPTNKPLSRKQRSVTRQVATKIFQLPWRARCCWNIDPLPHHPRAQEYCVSKYSRTSPGCGKVDLKLHLPHIQGPVL